MNSRELAKLSGVSANTLNAWISRGYVPQISPHAQGCRRQFSVEAAIHIIAMGRLARFGISGKQAGEMAATGSSRIAFGEIALVIDWGAIRALVEGRKLAA